MIALGLLLIGIIVCFLLMLWAINMIRKSKNEDGEFASFLFAVAAAGAVVAMSIQAYQRAIQLDTALTPKPAQVSK